MTKTKPAEATKVSTSVTSRSLHPSGQLEIHFHDGHFLYIVPGRIKKMLTEEVVDTLRVQLSHLDGIVRGEYGRRNIYGEVSAADNEPLVRQYVNAAKNFVESEKPKNRRDRDDREFSRRLIEKALSYEG